MIALLISLVLWALIFYVVWWGMSQIVIPEPFGKVLRVLLILAVVIVLIGLLTGSIGPFPVLQNL